MSGGDHLIKYYGMQGQRITAAEWVEWVETSDRHVARTIVRHGRGKYYVSTIALGFNHNWVGNGPPLLFETMVFRDSMMNPMRVQERYSTPAQARRGHALVLRALKRTLRNSTRPKQLISNGGKP